MTTSVSLTPVQQTERIQILDILRGFALFGILFVNMTLFSQPMQTVVMPVDPSLPWHDRAAIWLIHALGEGKFYALFSLLFGLGLFLQMERVEARGGRFVPLYARRLLVLLGIGLIHAFLIWAGDILIIYALLGFLLLLFRKAKPRTLLVWVFVLIALPLLFSAAITALVTWASTIPEAAPQMEQAFAETKAGFAADLERAARVYATGNFAEITAQRVSDYFSITLGGLGVMGFNVMAMFLLGLYFGKCEIFKRLEAHRGLFVRLLVIGLALGLAGNMLYATLIMPISRVYQSWPLFLATAGQAIGAPLLMLAYVSAFCLLALHPVWGRRISLLAPPGQMALTNYLTQSIVCTLIFYSYGLRLFGKMGAAMGIGLTILIYLLQIPFSHWWMKHFYYGPAEWLWRSLTYLKPQPMKRTN